jgi:hypothetical protein
MSLNDTESNRYGTVSECPLTGVRRVIFRLTLSPPGIIPSRLF